MPTTASGTPLWLAVIGQIVTFLAVVVALFGDWIRGKLLGPRLRIESIDNFRPGKVLYVVVSKDGLVRVSADAGKFLGMVWLLRVVNDRSAAARNCCVEVRRIQRRGPIDQQFHDEPLPFPLQLYWTPSELNEDKVTVLDQRTFDFGSVREIDEVRQFTLQARIAPANFTSFVRKGDCLRFHLFVLSEQYRSTEPFIVEVAYDGEWSEHPERMQEHVRMRHVPSESGGGSHPR